MVKDARGAPVNSAVVRLTLTMPSMIMPSSVVNCHRPTDPAAAPGYYVGVGTFTMTGTWRLGASALLPGGGTLTASRQVAVR